MKPELALKLVLGRFAPPLGFTFLIDADGAYLVDADGAFLVEPI